MRTVLIHTRVYGCSFAAPAELCPGPGYVSLSALSPGSFCVVSSVWARLTGSTTALERRLIELGFSMASGRRSWPEALAGRRSLRGPRRRHDTWRSAAGKRRRSGWSSPDLRDHRLHEPPLVHGPQAAGRPQRASLSLIGVPNCGKTALFNRLTGSRQKVANYPGVTVERKEGRFIGPPRAALSRARSAGRL